MSRAVVLVCLCALPIAVLTHQAEMARTLAATLAEMDRPGAIDPVDGPRVSPGESTIQAASSLETSETPSFLDGLLPVPGLGLGVSSPLGPLREPDSHTPPPASMLRRLSRLQVFRN